MNRTSFDIRKDMDGLSRVIAYHRAQRAAVQTEIDACRERLDELEGDYLRAIEAEADAKYGEVS